MSAVAAAAVGVGALAPPAHAGDTLLAARPFDSPPIPEVPGMTGDPRANEFWFQYDDKFLFNPSQEIRDAYAAWAAALGSLDAIIQLWKDHRIAGTYPKGFIAAVRPAREPLAVVSHLELQVYDAYYGTGGWRELVPPFVDFGQGILFDPRRPDGSKVHMMNLPQGIHPPTNYHFWNAILQARIFLDVDADRWRNIARLVGLAWAVQSVAKPVTDAHNPPLAGDTIAQLEVEWLQLPLKRLDKAFESFPYPAGIS
jgi:hypothetical protein